jgi:hypothetical protein
MGWLDARPGIDRDMNFGEYYYAYTRGSAMDRTGGGQIMSPVSKTLVLAAFTFLFVGIVAVVLLLPTLY